MIEIKFQVYIKDVGMCPVTCIDFVNGVVDVQVSKRHVLRLALKNANLRQFTGFRDKNRKDIYEGHKIFIDSPEYKKSYPYAEINWDNYIGKWYARRNGNAQHDSMVCWRDFEIIGHVDEALHKQETT